MRRTLALFLVALSLLGIGLIGVAPAPAAERTGVDVDPGVRRGAANGEDVPVIVQLASGARAADVAASLNDGPVDDAKPLGDLPMVAATVDAAGLDRLATTPGVATVVPNHRRQVALAESVPHIGAPTAWAAGDTGSGQTIAVIDTGVATTHPFLAGKVVKEGCFTSATDGSTPTCPGPDPTESTDAGAGAPCAIAACYHGTHVAGIAVGGAGGAFSGVAPGASLIAVQVFSTYTAPADCSPVAAPCITAWDSDIVRALDWVYSLRSTFDIAAVNLSLGGPPTTAGCATEPEQGIVTLLRAAGIASTMSSGNAGSKSSIDAPACMRDVVSVGSTGDTTDVVSGFSNSDPSLSLLAPGSPIVSSVPTGAAGSFACPAPFAAGSCASAQGTSMAAPHVAGAFALLRAARPANTVTDDLDLLRSTGLPVVDGANQVSTPRIDVGAATRPPTYHPVAPFRMLDTRVPTGVISTAPLAGGTSMSVPIAGRGGVPSSGVSSVVLNVTAVGPTATSFVTVWPTDVERPLASNLNLAPGETRANLVTTALGADGSVSLFNNSGAVHLVADVAGWYDRGGTGDSGARYRPVTPVRVFDTRNGDGGVPAAPLAGGDHLTVDAASLCGFAAPTAVALNVTALDATAATHVTVWPADEAPPLASNVNLDPGGPVPNLVIVKVGGDGTVSLSNNAGQIDLLADLAGCFDGAAGAAGRFVPLTPARLLDTRTGNGSLGRVDGGETIDLTVAGRGGVPTNGAAAVVLNLTATEPSADTHLTAWPTGQAMPGTSNVNVVAGQTAPNLVIVAVGTGGQIRLFNNAGSTHVLADVLGWYGPSAP